MRTRASICVCGGRGGGGGQVGVLGVGKSFGELALLSSDNTRSATVRAHGSGYTIAAELAAPGRDGFELPLYHNATARVARFAKGSRRFSRLDGEGSGSSSGGLHTSPSRYAQQRQHASSEGVDPTPAAGRSVLVSAELLELDKKT